MLLAPQAGIFPDTRWSLILQVHRPEDQASAGQALNELCRVYWQPLYIYLRRSGLDNEAAKDTVQGFLAHFLSHGGFGRGAPDQGRFRYFLLGSLRNYLVSQARKEGALKRGGQAEFVPMDTQQAEEMFQSLADESLSPRAAYDRQWAHTVWSRALARLREEQRARGKEPLFEALKRALTEYSKEVSSQIAADTGLTPPALALAVHRLRRRLRELVLDELSQTVGANEDLAAELDYFLSIWSK